MVPETVSTRVRGLDLAIAAAVATVAALIPYHRALGFSFALDDYTFLFRAAGIDPDPFTLRRVLATRLYYELGYELFGVSSTLAWHLVSFLLHVGNALWVYLLARHFRIARDAAWLACALFAGGPLAFTVMYWIAGTQELSSTFFLLAATWVALQPGRRPGWSLPLFAAALLCKESVVAAPLLLPLLGGRRSLRLAAAQLGLALAFFIAAELHLRAFETNAASPYATDYGLGLLRNLGTAFVWLASPWRRYPDRIAEADPALLPWAAGMLIAGSLLLAFTRRRFARPALLASAWFVALLLPTLPLKRHFFAYYLYLPQVGFLILFAALALAGAHRLAGRPQRGTAEARLGIALFLAMLCLLFAHRNRRTHETLMLGRSLAHHDAMVRYGSVSGLVRAQIRDANLRPEVRRVAIVILGGGEGGLTPGTRKPVPGAVRRRTVPLRNAMYDGKFFALHFPRLQGNVVDALTAEDEGGKTAFFLAYDLATLEPLPDASAAYAILALSAFIRDDYNDAGRNAQRALALRPDEATARLVAAGVLARQGDVRDAERILSGLDKQGLGAQMGRFMQKVRDLIAAHESGPASP
ncbi:MAG: hypothetical protein JSW67_10815 [Candidatus Latescibacterota bacterium]|nr:MAG: hypothetical protein JSW67_10815 [Candidatus Latescibacterota bacterium]